MVVSIEGLGVQDLPCLGVFLLFVQANTLVTLLARVGGDLMAIGRLKRRMMPSHLSVSF